MKVNPGNELTVVTVNDIKQYIYCPRIIYFYYIVPVSVKPTYKMEAGTASQERVESLELRRGLGRYHLSEGERLFNRQLFSSTIGLSGKIDLIIRSGNRNYPVDFKHSLERVHLNHIMQLGAYSLLLEETFSCPVEEGFIYFVPGKRVNRIAITGEIKSAVREIIEEIRRMLTDEAMPEQPKNRNRCQDCEFKNYCNDVW